CFFARSADQKSAADTNAPIEHSAQANAPQGGDMQTQSRTHALPAGTLRENSCWPVIVRPSLHAARGLITTLRRHRPFGQWSAYILPEQGARRIDGGIQPPGEPMNTNRWKS